MSILCVGSVALDSVETPFGTAERVVGGSAVYFAAAATQFAPVQVVGVVGDVRFEELVVRRLPRRDECHSARSNVAVT